MAKKKTSGAKPAGRKKAASKKASAKNSKRGSKKSSAKGATGSSKRSPRKQSKRKGTTQVSIASLTGPTAQIAALANWAVDRVTQNPPAPAHTKKFRKDAVATGFQAALDAAVQDHGAPDLTDEERTYCEGWLYLARLAYHSTDADKIDKKLKKAAEKHLDDDGSKFHIMTG